MTNILITGGRGFLGRNLAAHLRHRTDCRLEIFEQDDSVEDLKTFLKKADVVVHLAGVNRPPDPAQFEEGNAGFTETLCNLLRGNAHSVKILFASSIQAELDNPYGRSKAKAEWALRGFAAETGSEVTIFRLKNLFGKWCRPNYNSVTATFCHNIARGLPIRISDPQCEVELSYVDDVIAAFLSKIFDHPDVPSHGTEIPAYRIQLGDLAARIQGFNEMRRTLQLPDFSDWFNRALYATYLSYVPEPDREYSLHQRCDARGSLAEFLKQPHLGQIFISRTKPGVTRGNHYHHTKTEKFLVVEGAGLIRMRSIEGGLIAEYQVSGEAYQVVDIPPGCTHSITNIGAGEMVTLFWSSEIFDVNEPDTDYLPVDFDFEMSRAGEQG